MDTIKKMFNRHFTSFTETDNQIYQTLLANSDKIYELTINELAQLSFTSKSSILRFVQKLGFRGFSDFKYSMQWDQRDESTILRETSLVDEVKRIEQVLENKKIAKLTHLINTASSICLLATGEDQNIQMKNFARILLKKGIISSQLRLNPDSELTKLVLDKLTEQNLLIVFSGSGNNKFMKQYLIPVINSNTSIVAITVFSNSWLTEVAELSFSLRNSSRNNQTQYNSGMMHLLINVLLEKAVPQATD